MKALMLICLQSICLLTFGQRVDYMKLRPTVLMMTCRTTDAHALDTSLQNLILLDTNKITKNLYIYYEDLGQCYWLLSRGQMGSTYLQKSIEMTLKALYHKPNATTALWNLSYAYSFNGQCDTSKYYMEKYKQFIKKKYWDEEQERELFAHCGN